MSQQSQNQEQNTWQRNARWMRVAVLTLTTIGPVVKTIGEWLQRRAQPPRDEVVTRGKKLIAATQETGQNTQAELQRRFEDISATTRQIAADQARELQQQARQLQSQAQSLRRALRKEARQRAQLQKVVKQVQRKSADWSHELLSRGEDFTENLVAQTGKISQGVRERGGAITHDLVESGGALTGKLAERGSALAQDLVERGEQLVHPARKRGRAFWTIVGFGVGLAAAASVTYIMIRRSMDAQSTAQDEQIELPSRGLNNSSTLQSRAAGEIRRLDSDAVPIATLPQTETAVETEVKAPYVGLKSSRRFYTREAFSEQFPDFDAQANVEDLSYFASEDEAKAQGYTTA